MNDIFDGFLDNDHNGDEEGGVTNFDLLLALMVPKTEEQLHRAIEIDLAILSYDFVAWLVNHAAELSEGKKPVEDHLQFIAGEIYQMLSEGDYRKAKIDEDHPLTLRETLLALAKRIERSEISVKEACDQGRLALKNYPEEEVRLSWWMLMNSISSAENPLGYDSLAELLYHLGQEIEAVKPLVPAGPYFKIILYKIDALEEKRQIDPAMEMLNSAIGLARQDDNLRIQFFLYKKGGMIMHFSASPNRYPDRWAQAERYYRQALDLTGPAGIEDDESAYVLLGLGNVLAEQGKNTEGISYLNQALEIRRNTQPLDPEAMYVVLEQISETYEEMGDYRTAQSYLLQALDVSLEIDKRVSLLTRLATVLSYMGEGGADSALKEAMALLDGLPDSREKQNLTSNLYGTFAMHRSRTGDLQGAIDDLEIAINAAIAAPNIELEARWQSNLGQIYMLLRQWQQAEKVFRQAAEGHTRMNDNLGGANLYMNLGLLSFQQNRLVSAAKAWGAAFVLFYNAQQESDMGAAAQYLGWVYRAKDDLDAAERCVKYYLSKAEDTGSQRMKAYALGGLADVQAARGDASLAEQTYSEAIHLAEKLGDLSAEMDYRLERGHLRESQSGCLDAAEADYRRSVEILETIRGRFRATERRIQFQSHSDRFYSSLILLLINQGGSEQSPGASDNEEAFLFAERSHSHTLSEMLGRANIPPPQTLPAELASQEARLLKELVDVEESGSVGGVTADAHARLNARLEDLWREIAAIDESCSQYVTLRRIGIVRPEELVDLFEMGGER